MDSGGDFGAEVIFRIAGSDSETIIMRITPAEKISLLQCFEISEYIDVRPMPVMTDSGGRRNRW